MQIKDAIFSHADPESIRFTFHELRAPVRAIRQLSNILSVDKTDSEIEKNEKILAFIHDRGDTLDRLLSDFDNYLFHSLDASPIESIRLLDRLSHHATDIIETKFSATFNILQPYWGPNLLIEVLSELISNAVSFSQGNLVVVEQRKEFNRIIFSVTDNGIGIAENRRKLAFQEFRVLQNREKHLSSGLGLSLVKRIIQYHRQKIWIDGNYDNGLKVCFSWPIASESHTLQPSCT